MYDKEKMYDHLKQAAEGEGLRYAGASDELLKAFGCSEVFELHGKLWDVYRILRSGRLAKDATAAMTMLDIGGNADDEQPTKDAAQRLEEVDGFLPRRSYRNGLYDIVAHFESVVWALDRVVQ